MCVIATLSVLYLENVSRGGGGKTEVPRNREGGAWNPTVLSDHAILIDIRLDEFPRRGEKKAIPP